MSGNLQTYRGGDLTIVISHPILGAAHVIGGFDTDSIVSIERPNAAWSNKDTADGRTVRSHNKSRTVNATIHLSQGSRSNDVLQGFYNHDERSLTGRDGIFTCTIADKSGRSYLYSNECYVTPPQNYEFNVEAGVRDWIITLAGCEGHIGGNDMLDVDTQAVLEQLNIQIDDTWKLAV